MKCSMNSSRFSTRGRPPTIASMMTPKLVCSGVCLYRLLSTTSGISPRLSSIDDPHAFAVGFVADVDNALDGLLANQLGDLLDQPGLVDLIGNLGDDDRRLVALLRLLELVLGAQEDRAAAGAVGIHDALATHDEAAGGEVRSFDETQQMAETVVPRGQPLGLVPLLDRLHRVPGALLLFESR